MIIYRFGFDPIEHSPDASVTIGTFDGVHLGHRAILSKVLEGAEPTVVTFDPHPQHVMRNRPGVVAIITPTREKLRKLELLGIQRVIIIPFDRKFASITAEDFLQDILMKRIGFKRLVIGFNHSFGRNREGNPEFLRRKSEELGFELQIIGPCEHDGVMISSTLIRKTISAGKIRQANLYLGNPFRLIGMVIKGDGRGHGLGYPTANLQPMEEHCLIPAEGVYAARIYLNDSNYPGMVSIGSRATFGEHLLVIEAHLFDFKLDLYGQIIALELLEYLRDQKRFNNPEDLIVQMRDDEKNARRMLYEG